MVHRVCILCIHRCKIGDLRSSGFCYNSESNWLQTAIALLGSGSRSKRTGIRIPKMDLGPSYTYFCNLCIINIEACFLLWQVVHPFSVICWNLASKNAMLQSCGRSRKSESMDIGSSETSTVIGHKENRNWNLSCSKICRIRRSCFHIFGCATLWTVALKRPHFKRGSQTLA
jgi:hypothetical protein